MIGIDVLEVKRLEAILERRGRAFIERAFTPEEQAYLRKKAWAPRSLAGIIAAKEAIAKAQGLGLFKMGIKNIEVRHDRRGRPYGLWKNETYLLSISHDGGLAIALAKKEMGGPRGEVPAFLREAFPYPKEEDHKGTRGRAGLYGGQLGMLGSAFLATRSALRVGAGYSYHILPKDLLPLMSLKYVEEIALAFEKEEEEAAFLKGLDALAIGPGLGKGEAQARLLKRVLALDKKIVCDADALSLLARDKALLRDRQAPTVLTPHLGEMARLTGLSPQEIQDHREAVAQAVARDLGAVVLLKGPGTLVTDGKRTYTNPTGNPGLATAGSGDTLTGIILGLLAQGLGAYEGACLGAYLHGLAGDLAAQERTMNGMVASHIIDKLPQALGIFYGQIDGC
ncbi:MAG: NAD(P)H-hydrate dehydratase [Tissierellia bacterium]|nr:NAD(P)H-hydrate dehydratase [Tissierellia bacterium]